MFLLIVIKRPVIVASYIEESLHKNNKSLDEKYVTKKDRSFKSKGISTYVGSVRW